MKNPSSIILVPIRHFPLAVTISVHNEIHVYLRAQLLLPRSLIGLLVKAYHFGQASINRSTLIR